MTVLIENETAITLDFDAEQVIRDVVAESLAFEECPYEAEVSVTLTDNAGIREVNAQFRQLDQPTDVLSFPMANFEIPGDFSRLEEDPDVFDPETGAYLMGDIMISLEKVREQAALYGHSERRELGFLVAHSMLHLMGYDHMEDGERLVMEARQAKILENLGITR